MYNTTPENWYGAIPENWYVKKENRKVYIPENWHGGKAAKCQ